jgi:hypothetical protein
MFTSLPRRPSNLNHYVTLSNVVSYFITNLIHLLSISMNVAPTCSLVIKMVHIFWWCLCHQTPCPFLNVVTQIHHFLSFKFVFLWKNNVHRNANQFKRVIINGTNALCFTFLGELNFNVKSGQFVYTNYFWYSMEACGMI